MLIGSVGRWHGNIEHPSLFNIEEEIRQLEETIDKANKRLKYLKSKKQNFEKKFDATNK